MYLRAPCVADLGGRGRIAECRGEIDGGERIVQATVGQLVDQVWNAVQVKLRHVDARGDLESAACALKVLDDLPEGARADTGRPVEATANPVMSGRGTVEAHLDPIDRAFLEHRGGGGVQMIAVRDHAGRVAGVARRGERHEFARCGGYEPLFEQRF